jgi:hypothetical protein
MTVNKKIQTADYNDIRTKVITILGPGSADSGYGQTILSTAVTDSNNITINEWGKLYYDIVNCYVHQTGAVPAGATSATLNNIIKSDIDTTIITAARSGTSLIVYGVTSGMVTVGQTISGTGIVGTPTITAAAAQTPITISSFVSKTGTGPYYVAYTIPAEPLALETGLTYTVAGNSNATFNGTFAATASTTTSLTLKYDTDPERTVISTVATNITVSPEPLYTATGTLSSLGPNRVFVGKSIFYMSVTNFNNANYSGMFAVGNGISGTGIPANTTITSIATATTSIGDDYYAINISNPFSSTSTTGSFSVGSAGTRLKVTSTVGVLPGMSIAGAGFTSQTVSSVINDTMILLSAAPGSTPISTVIFKLAYGTGTTTVTASMATNPWGRSTWTTSTSQTLASRSLTLASATEYPYSQYDAFANTLTTNKFSVAVSQASTTAKGSKSHTWPSATLGTFWNGTVSSIVQVSFSSAAQARYFFNSGGEIRFASSRTGGATSPTPGHQQNTAWTNLLSPTTVTPKAFGGNKPSTGTAPADGNNFYRLTSTYQIWSTSTASSPYTSNVFRISARTPSVPINILGTATVIEFLVEWIDGYVDPGPAVPENPAPGDQVDGTLTLAVNTYEATGVLQPSGTGTFTVESPSVTISDLTTAGVPVYLITPSVTSVNEGGTVTFNISGYFIPDGTYTYEIVGTNVTAADFTDATLTNSGIVTSNAGSFSKTLVNDVATEDLESFVVRLKSGTTVLATSQSIAIQDTSALRLITASTSVSFITGSVSNVAGGGWQTISSITCTRRGTARFSVSITATSNRIINYRLVIGTDIYTFADGGVRTATTRSVSGVQGPYIMAIGTVIRLDVEMYTDAGTSAMSSGSFALLATEV